MMPLAMSSASRLLPASLAEHVPVRHPQQILFNFTLSFTGPRRVNTRKNRKRGREKRGCVRGKVCHTHLEWKRVRETDRESARARARESE